jgi:hypothetical protein
LLGRFLLSCGLLSGLFLLRLLSGLRLLGWLLLFGGLLLPAGCSAGFCWQDTAKKPRLKSPKSKLFFMFHLLKVYYKGLLWYNLYEN